MSNTNMINTDMKLLMETWRKYSDTIENAEQLGSVYLFENKTAVKKDFEFLLQEFDSGKITEDRLYKCWNKSMLYEQKLLSEELGIDWEKEGELVQDPDYVPPQERPGKLDTAMQKAKDWVLEKSVQIYAMAKRGLDITIKALGALLSAAKRFQEKHPIVAKVIVVIVLAIAIYALMSAFGSEAQASIQVPDRAGDAVGLMPGPENQISDQSYEALRGLIHQTKGADMGETSMELRANAMLVVDTAQESKGVVDLSTLTGEYGKFASEQIDTLNGLFRLAREGDVEAFEWIKDLVETGKNIEYKVGGTWTRATPKHPG